jgi:hypothetical protein
MLSYTLFVYLYVFLRIEERSEKPEVVGEVHGVAPKRQVVPLINTLYTIMFLVITVTCLG